MKILLSYSKTHFDPTLSPSEHKHWGSSASIIARTLYETLSAIGDVTYIDFKDYARVAGQSYDIVVTITNNMDRLLSCVTYDKLVIMAVNMHPITRNRILMDFCKKNAITALESLSKEIVSLAGIEWFTKADQIFVVGNEATVNSYLENGVLPSKIKALNYAALQGQERSVSLPREHHEKRRFLYIATEMTLRKGFDIICDLFTEAYKHGVDFQLSLVGACNKEFYTKKLELLRSILGDQLTIYGWVESSSEEYSTILENHDFLIFPSLEEGQAGTVLDGMMRGIIPIVSQHAGVDFSPLGMAEMKIKSERNLELIHKAVCLDDCEMNRLHWATLTYYKEFHEGFESQFAEAFRDFIKGGTSPKFSVILPIFNKEKTITPLLQKLHLACTRYGNIELHIIFDGCHDKSEQVTREFFADKQNYEITYEVTPDIFEVKTNNIGLRKATGKYCAIIQDDIFIYNPNIFFDAAYFLEKDTTCAILGGLAGVNFYPRGTNGLKGKGQICMNENEVYWRQDEKTDPSLKQKIFQVDACMRGPLIIRKSFMEKHGYLDENFAPLYNDDMDICLRASECGYKVYAMLMNVRNGGLTMSNYDEAKTRWWAEIIRKNTDLFYSRHQLTSDKSNYLSVQYIPMLLPEELLEYCRPSLLIKYFLKPGAFLLSHICPSKFHRKRLYNYYKLQ
ncbi:MAG: glycosyltransferase [Akkermansia sp.]